MIKFLTKFNCTTKLNIKNNQESLDLRKTLPIIIFSFILPLLILSCKVNNSELQPGKKPITSNNKPITPLTAPQRFGLLPIEQKNLDNKPSTITQKTNNGTDSTGTSNTPEKSNTNNQAGSFIDFNLVWNTPSGWFETPKKPMRVVTFRGGENSNWECYISVISSQAGGIQANLSRWAKQMGSKNTNDINISKLPNITILGQKSPLIEINGTYTDMEGIEHPNYKLIGAICPLENSTVFIKMIGPEPEVTKEKENFIELCNSLRINNEESTMQSYEFN